MQVLQGKDKMNITNAIRCEIITSISTLVMVYTMSPTPEERTVLAQRLVAAYPILADNFGCGYVSTTLNIPVMFHEIFPLLCANFSIVVCELFHCCVQFILLL